MDVLWELSTSEPTVKEIGQSFPELAYTTVATTLDRLVEKSLARCRLERHTKRYAANGSRAAYTAMAMYGSLRRTSEPRTALARFVEVLSPEDRASLRAVLQGEERRTGKRV